ncbi:hypothetical protein BDZ94DRAFT_1253944, partial [Collybia nuda]
MYKLFTAALLVFLVPQALAIPKPEGGMGTLGTACRSNDVSNLIYCPKFLSLILSFANRIVNIFNS